MFQKITEIELYKSNVISLVKALFSSPDGKVFERDIVRHLGAVSVVPLLADQKTVLVLSQFRASLGRTLIEVPAGKRDVADEAPELTAVRELEEEIGVKCSELIRLGEFENSPGFTDEHSFSYLALGLSAGKIAPQSVEERESSIVAVTLDSVPELISRGTITDAKTIIGLMRTSHFLSTKGDERGALYPRVWSLPALSTGGPKDSDKVTAWSRTLTAL